MSDTEQPATDSVDARMTAFFAAPEAATEEAPEPTQEVASTETTEEQVSEEPTSEVFEVDGVEYQLPPELKTKVSEWREGALRREDYTRKTQETAELHRQAQALQEQVQRAQQFEKSISAEKSELGQIEHQLSQFKNVNWGELDVEQYIRLKGQADTLKERATTLKEEIANKHGEFSKTMDAKKREVIESGHKYLSQAIPGWGEKAIKEVVAVAKDVGFTEAELENILDARQIHLAWKAAQFDKLQAAKPAALAAVQKAPPVVKPGASKPGAATEQKYRDARQQLKKSGDFKDAASLFKKFM